MSQEQRKCVFLPVSSLFETICESGLGPLVDASEHAAIIEVLGLRERQLLFQVANSLLAILEFTSLTIGEAGKTLRHENVNLLVKRIQKLNSGREHRYACHTQFLSETLWLKPFQPE
jgi:hypothetical protein